VIADASQTPTWVLTLRSADAGRRAALLAAGVTLIDVDPDSERRIDLAAALAALGERGVTRLLIEGGARLAAALLRVRLVDRLAWFHAPLLIGGDGTSAVAALGLDRLVDAPGFERLSVARVGDDMLTTFRARA
jgi:diaminohydroxyphosphoribosylaminopyrimidine deaminase / 5-amino-6-(5-phosphoribosylamino)uracil reductase